MKEITRQKVFWQILVMISCSMSFPNFIKPALKNYGSTKFNDDQFLTQIGMFAFSISALGKFFWGILYDKFGFIKCYSVMLIMEIFACFTMDIGSSSKVGFCIWIVFIFSAEGAHFTLFPNLASEIYGPR